MKYLCMINGRKQITPTLSLIDPGTKYYLIPEDGSFDMSNWRYYDLDGKFDINLVREHKKNDIRALRDNKLKELDVEFLKEVEYFIMTGIKRKIKIQTIINNKNKLRNLPEQIDKLESVKDIENIKIDI